MQHLFTLLKINERAALIVLDTWRGREGAPNLSLTHNNSLRIPNVIATEIADYPETTLEQFTRPP